MKPTSSPPVPALVALLVTLVPATAAADSSREARSTIAPSRTSDADRLQRSAVPPSFPTIEGKLAEEIQRVWAGRILRRGTTAVYVIDAHSGAPLYSVHPDEKLNPASNVKLVSTATALDILGPDWRYETRLLGAAIDGEGTSRGDVYLLGNFDPTLSPGRLAGMARGLAKRGLRRIDGAVVLSDDLLRDNLGSARVAIEVSGRGRAGSAASVSVTPASEYVQVEVTAKIASKGRNRLRIATREVELEDGQSRLVITVGGFIRAGQTQRFNRGVPKRSTFTAHTMRSALIDAGIEVTGGVTIASFDDYVARAAGSGYLPVELAITRSRPVSDLAARINKRSLNYLSDRLVMSAGAAALGGRPSMASGIEAMRRWLAQSGIDPDAVVLDTGSGLSYQTQLSARQIVEILRIAGGYASRDDQGGAGRLDPEVFHASLAVGGVDGTLRGRFRGSSIAGRLLGKTGTLTGIIALSGYLTTDDGQTLIFAIVTNGHARGHRNSVRREHEHLVTAMHGFLRARSALLQNQRGREADLEAAAPAEVIDSSQP